MKYIHKISRYIVGIVFIFSGFVKAIDPIGSEYKFTDYFLAFNLDFMIPTSLYLAFVVAALEFIVGIALVINVKMNKTSYLALMFMVFFAPLTLFLALTNPVTDCGCFGDALIISNWQTFYKNIVLLILSVLIFVWRKEYKSKSSNIEQNIFVLFFLCFILSISIYSYKHLPLIDFRPYSIGSNISDGMTIPEGAEQAEYKSIFTYKKGDISKEFDESNYPWKDSTWVFVDSEQIKIKEGYKVPIHDFSIENTQSGNITEEVLTDNNYSFLMIAKDLSKVDNKQIESLQNIYMLCLENNYRFICLTSSSEDSILEFKSNNNINYEFYNTDEIQLKTMIRSTPGLILLKDGTILDKWHINDIPENIELAINPMSKTILHQQQEYNRLKIINISILLLLIICMYNLFIRKRE